MNLLMNDGAVKNFVELARKDEESILKAQPQEIVRERVENGDKQNYAQYLTNRMRRLQGKLK